MKGCIGCGKKLGIMEGYRHPTLGNDYLLCSDCFDSVSVSVEKWREVISSYVGFFRKEESTIEERIGNHIMKNMEKIQNGSGTLWSHQVKQNAHESLSRIN